MSETRIETYIPLYRKYRPQTFADVVGQEAIVQTLGNAISLNKVAHAYLFCGPRGTGKTSTARIFAKSLNCEQGPTVTPCLQCASCTGITAGNALDVIEFDAASNNGVSDARELIENCQYTSMTGRFKVYIIDEVHMLTPQAFNALLKTLEEPPPNVIFIFATTEGHKVLPTIISRCQRFDFNRITTDSIVGRLRQIAERESIAIDEEALLMIGRHARGGLRDAVGLLDQVAVLGRGQKDKIIGRKDVALFIGTLEEDLLLRLSAAIAERRAADLLHELNELTNRGIEPIQLLKDLTVHFRNLLLVQAAGPQTDPEQLSLPPDYFGQLAEQVKLFPEPEEVPQIIARLSFVERNIRNSSQPQLWLEVGLMELAYRHEIHLVKELSERLTRLENQLAGGAPIQVQAPPAQRSAPQAPPRPAPPQPMAQAAAAPVQSRPDSPAQPAPAAQAQPTPTAMPQTQPLFSEPMPAPPAARPAPAVPAVAASGLEGTFNQIIAAVPSLPTRSLLQQQAFAISFENDLLVLGCTSEPTLNLLKKPEKFIHLQKAANKALGREVRIDLLLEKKAAEKAIPAPVVTTPEPATVAQPVPAPESEIMAPNTPVSEPVSVAPVIPAPAELASASPQANAQSASGAVAVLEAPPMLEVEAVTPLAPAVPEPAASPEVPGPEAVAVSVPAAAASSLHAETAEDDFEPDLDAPPLEDEAGSAQVAASQPTPAAKSPAASAVAPVYSGTDEDLAEAKKHAVELLQGKVLD